MTKAVAKGWPKHQIAEAALKRQAAVDKGETVVVGVNKYRLEDESKLETRMIDNAAVRKSQVARLQKIRASRSNEQVKGALDALKSIAASGQGNLLAAAVEAARVRASLGEISDALREQFGAHEGKEEIVTGVHAAAYDKDPEYNLLRQRLADYAKRAAKRPRLLVAKLGQDGHDRGAQVIASGFADLGFDVVPGPMFQTPEEAAALAIGEKVDVVGVSSLAAGHRTLVPQLAALLKSKGQGHIAIVCGGVIPREDYAFLKENGVAEVFGPGTNVLDAARSVLDVLEGRLRN
jgi:methylmalonyl-CoA mutase